MSETASEHIARVQRGLSQAKAFHADYLARRRARGLHTATDVLMQQHQETLADALDLLEAMKAMVEAYS